MNASSHLQKPLFLTLGQTIDARSKTLASLAGKALPCRVSAISGIMVTVDFEIVTDLTLPQVTIPVYGTQWIREPIAIGDGGIAIPADVMLSGIVGLTPAVTTQTPSNLGALFFLPLPNVSFTAADPLKLILTGPNGVVIADEALTEVITITAAGITISSPTSAALICGGNSVTVTPAGVDITGVLTINGAPYLLHTHSGVTTGTGVSGPVV